MKEFILFLLMYNIFHRAICDCQGYFVWNSTATTLFCPKYCANFPDESREYQRCCSCNSVPEWRCNSAISIGYLFVEYIDSKGWNQLIDNSDTHYDFYRVIQDTGFMSQLPLNICDFPKLVLVDFSYNDIHEIGRISCLKYIDTLILKGNIISTVRKNTFVGLKHLRTIDLSWNIISYVEPGTLSPPDISMTYMLFSNNILEYVDATNIAIENPFCKVDFSRNRLKDITNEQDWKINPNKTYGSGGTVDLTHNCFKDFFDFTSLGFPHLELFGKLILRFSFDLRESKWDCNCKMQPFLTLSEFILQLITSDIFLVRCSSPEHMKGDLIIDHVRNKSLDLFICDIKKDCPFSCLCFHQPSQNRTVVNCSHRGLERMPRHMPSYTNLVVDLSRNLIRRIENMNYLSNISELYLHDNMIISIQHLFVERIENAKFITLFGNKNIKTLPKNIQRLAPCVFDFGDLILDCTCGMLWIKEWMEAKRFDSCNQFMQCRTDKNGNFRILDIADEIFDCDLQSNVVKSVAIVLTIMSVFIGISSFISNWYRYEIFIIWKKFRKTNQTTLSESTTFDAFVSFSENNQDLFTWINNKFVPSLEGLGYRLFVPYRDLDPGSIREEELREKILQSKNVIVFLSEDYFTDEGTWTIIEWRLAWNFYRSCRKKDIIFINFDQIRACSVENVAAKAFMRLGFVIDFANKRHELMKRVRERLGNISSRRQQRFNKNRKPKFDSNRIKPMDIYLKIAQENLQIKK